MRDQKALLTKIRSIRESLRELETMLNTGNDTYRIVAGWSKDSLLVGLIDLQGTITYSVPKSNKDVAFAELEPADVFRIVSRGVHKALGMIPVTTLQRYLQDDGPQIELSMTDILLFGHWNSDHAPEEIRDLAKGMLEHCSNYRVKTTYLSDKEFQLLLED